MGVISLPWLLGVAASVLVAVGVFRLFRRSDAEDLYFYGGSRDED
jgi:hypothetical protein